MTIETDVAAVSKHFGVDAKLIQSVVIAEGGGDHIIKAVQCSIPSVSTREEALEITCRSAVHAMSDWIKRNDAADDVPLQQQFVEFWAARWAPQGVANDPRNLNANWSRNVLTAWTRV